MSLAGRVSVLNDAEVKKAAAQEAVAKEAEEKVAALNSGSEGHINPSPRLSLQQGLPSISSIFQAP